MTDRTLRTVLSLTVAGATMIVAASCGGGGGGGDGTPPSSSAGPNRIECPITKDTIVIDSTYVPAHVVTVVPVAREITHVPEFHDCQRLIVSGAGGLGYDSLVAIFAAYDLPSLAARISVQRRHPPVPPPHHPRPGDRHSPTQSGMVTIPQPVGDTSEALSFAELYSWGGTYARLGIKPGFNCLYVLRISGTLYDYMVTVKNEGDCLKPLYTLATDFSGEIVGSPTPLTITPTTPTGTGVSLVATDIPAVARWDWDTTRKEQFIGIRCGSQWCAVGSSSDLVAPPLPNPGTFDAVDGYSATANEISRVWQVKGWQDFQLLAQKDESGHLRPSVPGWIYPNPVLGDIKTPGSGGSTPFDGHWVHVATAVVGGAYHQSPLDLSAGANKIYLCKGPSCPGTSGSPPPCTDGAEVWWSRIGTATPRSACRHTVPNYDPPGTARWRWLAGDETTWTRCVEGCCQLQ